jgi:hypothetical protein
MREKCIFMDLEKIIGLIVVLAVVVVLAVLNHHSSKNS